MFDFARNNPSEIVTVKMQFDEDGPEALDRFYKKVVEPNESLFIRRTLPTGEERNVSDISLGDDSENRGNIYINWLIQTEKSWV